jgi:hypothetical protein
MHTILLDTVAILRKRLDAEVSDAFTSRELLKELALDERRQAAFRDIVFRVESTWFGQRSATSVDYTAVRERFHVLSGVGTEAV